MDAYNRRNLCDDSFLFSTGLDGTLHVGLLNTRASLLPRTIVEHIIVDTIIPFQPLPLYCSKVVTRILKQRVLLLVLKNYDTLSSVLRL